MDSPARLPVVLLWHMHQPQYRDALSGEYVLPWTYLHAIKDYTDMAAHLEENPAARAVVNFTPVLLDQLDEYSSSDASSVPACRSSGIPSFLRCSLMTSFSLKVGNVVHVDALRTPFGVHGFGHLIELRLRLAAVIAHQHDVLEAG